MVGHSAHIAVARGARLPARVSPPAREAQAWSVYGGSPSLAADDSSMQG